jgi:DHA3 family macrolide efflux protein-like MFS transporter
VIKGQRPIAPVGQIWPRLRKLFAFFVIVITQTISLIGSRMTAIAVGIWLFNHTGNTSPLLLTAFFTELPGMMAGGLAGVLIDRWDRRRVLMLADAGQAVGTLLLAASFGTGHFQIWQLYVIVLLQGSFATIQGPAKEAATTMLVPEPGRERANAVQQMAFPLAGVIAPVLAGLVYALVNVTGVVLIDLLTFAVALAAVLVINIPSPMPTEEGQEDRGDLFREFLAGWRYLSRRRSLLYLVLYLTLISFLLNGPLELTIPYLIAVTDNEELAGVLLGLGSLGAFSGAALIAVWGGTRPRMHTLLPGLLLTGVMFLVYGMARSTFLLGASMFLLFLPLPMMGALFVSIIQVKTPPDMQGRIFALIAQLGFLASTTSFLATGPLVDRVLEPAVGRPGWRLVEPIVGPAPGAGMGLLLVLTGLLILVSTLAVYGWPLVRRLEITLPDYVAVAED